MSLQTLLFFAATLLLSVFEVFSRTLPQEFPRVLTGTWVQPDKKESGVMHVRVHEHNEVEMTGVIEIRGSKDCPQPIVFRGMVAAERVVIESRAEIVCGHGGKLTGVVSKNADGAYVGSFEYRYFGLTWARGTFTLSPKEGGD